MVFHQLPSMCESQDPSISDYTCIPCMLIEYNSQHSGWLTKYFLCCDWLLVFSSTYIERTATNTHDYKIPVIIARCFMGYVVVLYTYVVMGNPT